MIETAKIHIDIKIMSPGETMTRPDGAYARELGLMVRVGDGGKWEEWDKTVWEVPPPTRRKLLGLTRIALWILSKA